MPRTTIPIFHNLPQYTIPSINDKKLAKLVATLFAYKDIIKPQHKYTWGQELETYTISRELMELSTQYLAGHRDLSGPWEIVPYPTKYNDPLPAFIITTMQRLNYLDIKPDEQMGNHIHYRPAPVSHKTIYLWWKTYLNLYTTTILMIRMMSSHGTYLRDTWKHWAELSKEYPMKHYLNKYPNEHEQHLYKELKYITGREYYHITLNKHNKNILTIEMRISETHPLKAWAYIYLITKITKTFSKPLFLVEDTMKFGDYYYDLAEGYVDDKETVNWKDIGLKPQHTWLENIKSPKELTIKLYSTLLNPAKPRDYLAMVIFHYIYKKGENIVDRTSVELFYSWLRQTKKEEVVERNLITILAQNT